MALLYVLVAVPLDIGSYFLFNMRYDTCVPVALVPPASAAIGFLVFLKRDPPVAYGLLLSASLCCVVEVLFICCAGWATY